MKVLVTGATGFLGSHLVKYLIKRGHEVKILKRSYSDTYRIKDVLPQIQSYDIDLCDLAQLFKENSKFDSVIHTATSYGRKGENAHEVFKANTYFPLLLMETASFFKAETFLNTDTILYKYLNSYSLSKKHFMEWGKQFASMEKIKFINIKLEHMYGPLDDDSKFTTYVIKNCLSDEPELNLTLGEQKRDFIYIDDVVSAYQAILDSTAEQEDYFQEYELGTGQPVSIRAFVETVRKLTKSKTRLNFGALPYRENEIMESCASIEKLSQLGWKPNENLESGIKKILQGKML